MWLSLLLLLRYVLFSGIPYLWFYVFRRQQYEVSKLQASFPSRQQIWKEILYSILTLLIYSIGISVFLVWVSNGHTQMYTELETLGWWYFGFSVLGMIFLHDTYYYWLHRWIHTKSLFKSVHGLHHSFRNPSPWCSFSFHPYEAILSMGAIPLMTFIIPWHPAALAIFVSFMMLYDTFIHLGFDIRLGVTGKWYILPKDHDLHHRDARYNFGLYFSLWDRWMGTYRTPGA